MSPADMAQLIVDRFARPSAYNIAAGRRMLHRVIKASEHSPIASEIRYVFNYLYANFRKGPTMPNYSLEGIIQDLYSGDSGLRQNALAALANSPAISFADYEMGRDLYRHMLDVDMGGIKDSWSKFKRRLPKKLVKTVEKALGEGISKRDFTKDFAKVAKVAMVVGPVALAVAPEAAPWILGGMALLTLAADGNLSAQQKKEVTDMLAKSGVPEAKAAMAAYDAGEKILQHEASTALLNAAGQYDPAAIDRVRQINALAASGDPTGVAALNALLAANIGAKKSTTEAEIFASRASAAIERAASPATSANVSLLALMAA